MRVEAGTCKGSGEIIESVGIHLDMHSEALHRYARTFRQSSWHWVMCKLLGETTAIYVSTSIDSPPSLVGAGSDVSSAASSNGPISGPS